MATDKPPWVEGHVKIPASVLAEVERAGREAYGRDEEACILASDLGEQFAT